MCSVVACIVTPIWVWPYSCGLYGDGLYRYELLDYVLVSRDHQHAAPQESTAWVEAIKTNAKYMYNGAVQDDLSDHFPVWGHMVFEFNS